MFLRSDPMICKNRSCGRRNSDVVLRKDKRSDNGQLYVKSLERRSRLELYPWRERGGDALRGFLTTTTSTHICFSVELAFAINVDEKTAMLEVKAEHN